MKSHTSLGKPRLGFVIIALVITAVVARAQLSGDIPTAPQSDPTNPVILVQQLAAQVNALQNEVSTLQSQLQNVIAIGSYVSLVTVNNQPTVRFSGANVQLVNGLGSTATANGVGNLIIGYDEADASGTFHCTLGASSIGSPVDDATDCTNAGGSWLDSGFKTGSHYLILGSGNNYSRWGGLLAGLSNTSNNDFASVSGGSSNTAGGQYASVSGGAHNVASGRHASVSGGDGNIASGGSTSISGGYQNAATTAVASVSGGSSNVAADIYASVSGGLNNRATGVGASVSGGESNTASGVRATVSGGYQNTAGLGFAANVSGGTGNNANAQYSSILGGVSQVAGSQAQTIPALP